MGASKTQRDPDIDPQKSGDLFARTPKKRTPQLKQAAMCSWTRRLYGSVIIERGSGGSMTLICQRNSKIEGIYSAFLLLDVRVSCSCCRKDALCADCWNATGAEKLLQELGELTHHS